MSVAGNTVMRNYTDAITDLPAEAFLGSLLFFSISMADVNLDDARQELTNVGLKTDTLRKNLRPVDAFRKASNEFAKKFPTINGVRTELLVRPLGEDDQQAYRHLVLEHAIMQQGKKRNLRFEKLGEVRFTRGTKVNGLYAGHEAEAERTSGHLAAPLTTEQDAWLTTHIDGFEDRYQHLLTHMDSHAVRSFVREYIYNLGGILVKESGGLYFVAQDHVDEVAKLGAWVKSIGSEFHSLPLLNLVDQQDMIMEAFEEDTIRELDKLMGEVGKILSDPDRTVEEKTYDAYADKTADLGGKVAEYESMLGRKAGDVHAKKALYVQQLTSLAGRIRQSRTTKAKIVNATTP